MSDPNQAPGETRSMEIINPPREMRKMLNYTARFIAEMGSEYEEDMRWLHANDPIFNFMSSSDPCHAFYQQKIAQYRALIQAGANLDASGGDFRREVDAQPPEPPMVTVTFQELGMIRLTAQFVVRYGRYFLLDLAERVDMMKQRKFGFLKPKDSRFCLFCKLVESYGKVIRPHEDLKNTLRENATGTLLEAFFNRLQWQQDNNVIVEMTESEWDPIESEYLADLSRKALEHLHIAGEKS